MADTDETKTTKENATFEEDPVAYCQAIYEEAAGRNDDLRDTNEENRLFYEGQDKVLDERRNDTRVVRSALFIPEVQPAIDTRVGNIIAKVEEREFPVTIRPASLNPTTEEYAQARSVERNINGQLRDCGYLTDGFNEHVTAAEIYRTPSAVQVGWERKTEPKAVTESLPLKEAFFALMQGKPISRVVWKDVPVNRPFVDWVYPEDFLYEPNRSDFENTSEYVIRRHWLFYHELVAMANEQGWNTKNLEDMKDEIGEKQPEGATDSQRDAIEAEKDTPFRKGYRDGKFLLTENYIVTYDAAGRQVVNYVVMAGNKEIIKQRKTPYRGIKFPFVPIVANRLPGTLEGLSSVDRGKYMQRLYNEIFNSYLDGITYRIFPPFKHPPGMKFSKQPVYGPAEIWEMSDPDAFSPVIENPGQLPDLPALMNAVGAKLRDALNAIDIAQGFQSQQYEKATSTKLRAVGSATRAMPTHKQYGMALVKVSIMFLKMNQQYSDDAQLYVGDFIVDVPSLTNVSDPEQEKQDSLLLHSTMMQDPLFQSPTGMRKRRAMFEEVLRKFKKNNFEAFNLSEEELERDIQTQTEMQVAALEKQGIAEQMALEQAEAAPAQEA